MNFQSMLFWRHRMPAIVASNSAMERNLANGKLQFHAGPSSG
jgi:hypothetical protein